MNLLSHYTGREGGREGGGGWEGVRDGGRGD